MTRMLAVLFGIILISIGVAGFFPVFFSNDLLFNFLQVNTLLNLFQLLSGVIAIMAATQFRYARLYFQIIGVIYALLATVGFWHPDLYFLHVNLYDNLFHAVIGIFALLIGFKRKI